jgi:hypothetical protein
MNEIEQSYKSFAEKHNLHLQVTKLGLKKDSEWNHFEYEFTLSVGIKFGSVLNPGPARLTSNWSCGEGCPMTNPAVIARVQRRVGPAKYHTFGKITMYQADINKEFIKAATEIFEPSIGDILSSLKEDLSCVYCEGKGFIVTFEDFADEFGYNPDSRKAEKIYRECLERSQQLVRMLGTEAANELLRLDQ